MGHLSTTEPSVSERGPRPTISGNFLNAYEVLNPSALAWSVRRYRVERTDGQRQTHEDRREIKNLFFGLRNRFKESCRGYGFIIDVDERTAVVPSTWDIPSETVVGNYRVVLECNCTVNAVRPADRAIVTGIIREAVKRHFKDNLISNKLGALWQDYGDFCQMPDEATATDYLFCRRFGACAKVLRGNRWVLQINVSTATLDRMTFADYYRDGDVRKLAAMIEAKQSNRLTRQNRPVAVRVWWNENTPSQVKATVVELDDPTIVLGHATLPRRDQTALTPIGLRCRAFSGSSSDAPLDQIRLVLDSQITQEDHSETIIEPNERDQWLRRVRDFLEGIDLYGNRLALADTPVQTAGFPVISVTPPPLRLRTKVGGQLVLESPTVLTAESLKHRARKRSDHLRQHGFLESRPIKPLLAWPSHFRADRPKRMKADLNHIWRRQGIGFQFDWFVYRNVEELSKKIDKDGYTALLAVLPEASYDPLRPEDTHEKIKQRIDVPSQCIHHDHTLPESWVTRHPKEFRDAHSRLARRIAQQYELCLGNLLVKCHWIPFAPAEPFFYNTHVGLDVGGRHNNRAMACLGHGFCQPDLGLLFRPEEIPIDVQKPEPIPTGYLYRGLLQLFEFIWGQLTSAGTTPDFERSLFLRDGALLGYGDAWNEREALEQLHAELLRRGWVTQHSLWTAVEILKQAEGWRLLENGDAVGNPVVGSCVLPFEEDDTALICTTGAPYLSQGTARPLGLRIVEIYGSATRDEVIRDVVWEADLCFSKPDMGMRLPWVLHVADTGALQLSRSYQITGITV